MVFPVEIGLVDGGGVDQFLDFAVHVRAQAREIAGEGGRSGRDHPLFDATFDEIAPGLGEDHAGMAIEIIAQPAIIPRRRAVRAQPRGAGGRRAQAIGDDLDGEARGTDRPGKRAAQRERDGSAAASAISPNDLHRRGADIGLGSVSISAHNQRGPSAPPTSRTRSHASSRTSASASASSPGRCGLHASGMARRASRAPVRMLASSTRR